MNRAVRVREPKSPERVKIGDILSFTSAIIAIVASAIFYFAGWLYLAHWYSFFGIDTSQLNLPAQLIIIHGVPSILILLLTGVASVALFAIQKMFLKTERMVSADAPKVIILAYGLSLGMLVVITTAYILSTKSVYIPFEVLLAGIVSLVLTGLISVLNQLTTILTSRITISAPIGISLGFISFRVSRTYAIYRIITDAFANNDWKTLTKVIRSLSLFTADFAIFGIPIRLFDKENIEDEFEEDVSTLEDDFIQQVNSQKQQFTRALTETWQFWLGSILILYFLVSIATSAVFGEWDARMGKKSMVGVWQGEETYIYSTHPSLPLPSDPDRSNPDVNSYAYGPLMVLGSNDKSYFLTDWIYEFPYTEEPKVYVVSLENSLSLGMEMLAPTPTPTRVPFNPSPATATPSPAPSPTMTVTPTP